MNKELLLSDINERIEKLVMWKHEELFDGNDGIAGRIDARADELQRLKRQIEIGWYDSEVE